MSQWTSKFFWGAAWFWLSIGVLLIGVASLRYFNLSQQAKLLNENLQPTSSPSPQPTPTTIPESGQVKGVQTILETQDARPVIVANFLERYKSPLTPYDHYGQVFVDLADKNGFDFRLLPAIAMQESNLCKLIPPDTYNCLGFGIHARGTLAFPSYEANFERAARELKQNYIDIGLTTPEQIMTKYTPSSNGSWANSVNQWMAEMRYDDRQKGIGNKNDANVLEFALPNASP